MPVTDLVPRGLAWRLKRLNRLRWLTKYRILRRYDLRIRDDPRRHLSYVLLDPEVESYSFELANEDELCSFLAGLTGITVEQARAYAHETKRDPELNERLRARARKRFFEYKRNLPIGNRLLWYVLIRALKPGLVVETGIYHGLGSLVILRALERNAAEGSQGELLSVDVEEQAGWLVDERLRGRWRKVMGYSTAALEPALEGRTVDVLISDTPHTEPIQRHEYGLALPRAGERLALLDGSGGRCPTLKQLSDHLGVEWRRFVEQPRDHFWPASGVGIALIPGDVARAWDGRWGTLA